MREFHQRGINAIYGDASHANVLEHAHLSDAEVLVVAVEQPAAEFSITRQARKINPLVHIIVKTRFIDDVEDLYTTGANEVIPEEYETALTVFARVMNKFLIPRSEIDRLLHEHRAGAYKLYRQTDDKVSLNKEISNQEIHLPNIEVSSMRIAKQSALVGKSLIDLQFRRKFELNILAVQRQGKVITSPSPDLILLADDIVLIMGEPEKIACATVVFRDAVEPACDSE